MTVEPLPSDPRDLDERDLPAKGDLEISAGERSILDDIAEAYLLLDPDFRLLQINAKGLEIEGRPAAALLGRSIWEVWPSCEASDLGALLRRAMVDRVPSSLDHQARWPDGRQAWLEMRALPASEGLAVFYRDISDRKRVYAQLRDATARAETSASEQAAVLRQLAEGVIVTDQSGRITLVNAAAADIHGVERLDVAPEDYSETYHLFTEDGQPYEPHALPLARAVRGETIKDARWRIRRPDGREVLAIGSAQPLRDIDGHQAGAVLTVRDDTAREAAERSLRDLAETLEQRVKDRTFELAAAKQEAEAANEAKSEFLASMSHEIRTPLHGVLGLADLLRDTPLDADQELMVGQLKAAGTALLTIVNDILDFSRVEAGRIELEPQPFDLAGLIEGALSIVRPSAAAKGLHLSVGLDPAAALRVQGDPGRLRQVLLNLLNNAVKFTPTGTVNLQVTRLEGARDTCHIRFAVTDTGIGIPKDKIHRLFERFSQIDQSIRRQYGGTGLGLAISQQLVGLMGGRITVDSEEGRGSTFAFDIALPIAAPAATPDPYRASIEPISATRPRAKVLVVDDVELNLQIVQAVLEKAGHIVEVVEDGADAVRAVTTERYDLVLMDVQMPGMDGLTATRQIRALAAPMCQTPIVAMTANVLPAQKEAFRAAGMDDHVGKPFERDELYAAIERWRGRVSGDTRTA